MSETRRLKMPTIRQRLLIARGIGAVVMAVGFVLLALSAASYWFLLGAACVALGALAVGRYLTLTEFFDRDPWH